MARRLRTNPRKAAFPEAIAPHRRRTCRSDCSRKLWHRRSQRGPHAHCFRLAAGSDSGDRLGVAQADHRSSVNEHRCGCFRGPASFLCGGNASFDAVISMTVIHIIPSRDRRDQALRELVRVLKPGGRVAIFDLLQRPIMQRSCGGRAWRFGTWATISCGFYPAVRCERTNPATVEARCAAIKLRKRSLS